MHGTVKGKSWAENTILIIMCIITFVAARILDNAGMPQKWHAAIFGTLVPFAAVVSIKRSSWHRATFWISLGMWFALHIFLICLFFGVVLAGVNIFGFLWWLPVVFIETIALLGLQPALEKKLRSKRSH